MERAQDSAPPDIAPAMAVPAAALAPAPVPAEQRAKGDKDG